MFRQLKSDEIEARVATVSEKGCSLLLYKDARCDMNILDETVGAMNWMRSHTRDNANCIVSIWDKDKNQWISKEDTGTESFTEKEKGLASDSFKRACFNWGIGRELYTAPFIWISADKVSLTMRNGKYTTYDKFVVESIGYDDKRQISALSIKNQAGKRVYVFGNQTNSGKSAPEYKCGDCGKPFEAFRDHTSGKTFTPAEVFQMAKKRNADGVARCADCRKKKGGA